MGEILFARVDDRLIHGQVMTKWAKGFGCNSVFVIDNNLVKDEYMKSIYLMTAAASNLPAKILSVDDAISLWNKDNFGIYKVILLYKDIATVKESVVKGLPIKKLNIGGLAKSPEKKFVIPSVSLKKEEAEMLWELANDFNVEVFFQTLPESKRVNLDAALKLFGINK